MILNTWKLIGLYISIGVMSLICPLCGDVTVSKHSQLMTHIRLLHADDPNFMIQCNRQGCKRTFRKFTVYRNHVYAFHGTALDETTVTPHSCGETSGNPPVSGIITTIDCFSPGKAKIRTIMFKTGISGINNMIQPLYSCTFRCTMQVVSNECYSCSQSVIQVILLTKM